ncbi:MAG TPA: hypothetical protein VLS25_00055, partial [Dehalococcoidia bacterium]|nr:hypothetical protein [Dehalococcoidia bacterium]
FTDGRILTVRYTEDLGPPHYSIIPDNTQVYPPAGGERPFTTSGQILWVTADGRLLLPDGTEFYRQEAGSPDIYHQQLLGEFSGNLEKGSALVKWPLASPEGEAYAITLLEVSQGETNVTGTFRSTHDLYLGWWTPKGMRAVISVMPARPFDDLGAPLPALLDLTTGEYRPIPGPSVSADPPYPRWQTGRTIIDAVQTGPFARVVDTGSCLNIRDAPSAAANVLACAADGVLLTVTNPAPTVPPGVVTPPPLAGWLEVLTPAGVAGWVSTQYLER